MGRPQIINKRRALVVEKWGSFSNAAGDLGMRPERLGRILWGRVRPKPEEARKLAWRLQVPVSQIFPE